MKKIMALLIMIMMFCKVCVAFEPPDPNRWIEVFRMPEFSYWVDAKTIRFDKKYDDTYANIWVMDNKRKDCSHSITNTEINMNKRQFRILSTVMYDDKGAPKDSSSRPTPFEGIIPGTLGEAIYDFVTNVYVLRMQNNG